jgi:anti-sigma B factor antagonist
MASDALRVTLEHQDGTCVMHVAGELDIVSTPKLHEHLVAAMATGPRRLIVDLSRTTYMDSSGVAELALTGKKFAARGGSFELELGESKVKKILDIAGLSYLYVSER